MKLWPSFQTYLVIERLTQCYQKLQQNPTMTSNDKAFTVFSFCSPLDMETSIDLYRDGDRVTTAV